MVESPFMTLKDMAQFLGTTPAKIKSDLTRYPHRLPPKFSLPGERIVWHKDDVEHWVTQRRKQAKALALSQQPRVGSIRLTGSRSTYGR